MRINEVITGKDIGLTAVKGRLLVVKEVAKFLRVSERWCQSHMADKSFPIPWFPVGLRDRVVDSADLDKYLSKTKINAGKASLPLKAKRKIKNGGKYVTSKKAKPYTGEPVL